MQPISKHPKRILSTLTLVSLAAIFLSACGGGNVATINNSVDISQASYDRWLASTVANYEKAGNSLDSPDFEACINKTSQGGVDKKAAKANCQKQYQGLQKQVFAQLIQQGWALAAAKEAGIKIDEKQVSQQVKAIEKQYPTGEGGVNEEDLTWLAQSNSAQMALQQKAMAQIKPSNQELESFYQKNEKLFAVPNSRDVKLIVTSSKAKADQAAAALRKGSSWGKVFNQYNDPKLFNSRTPEAKNVSEGNFVSPLAQFVFSAPVKQVYGPREIKKIGGWAIVEVTQSNAAKAAPPFSKNKEQALAVYRSQKLSKESSFSAAGLAKKYQPKTDCSKDYEKWFPCKGTRP